MWDMEGEEILVSLSDGSAMRWDFQDPRDELSDEMVAEEDDSSMEDSPAGRKESIGGKKPSTYDILFNTCLKLRIAFEEAQVLDWDESDYETVMERIADSSSTALSLDKNSNSQQSRWSPSPPLSGGDDNRGDSSGIGSSPPSENPVVEQIASEALSSFINLLKSVRRLLLDIFAKTIIPELKTQLLSPTFAHWAASVSYIPTRIS